MTIAPRDREPMLAALAGAAERANRPTAVVVFCAALLALALLFASISRAGASEARRAYENEASQLAAAQAVGAEIKRTKPERKASVKAPG
ncbi:MAG: hypothetical protein IBJ10_04180, partial [Phycisphaerales bacterium]|nr:hypothetical protein [Phycisphaerales bacterium]